MPLGSSFDKAIIGMGVRAAFPSLDSTLMATIGELRFIPGTDGHIADIAGLAENLLIEQFRRDRPNIRAVVDSLAAMVQAAEDTLWDLSRFRSIPQATGVLLDQIGAIVGCSRTSADDDVYRADIYFQIAVNSSSGEPETLIAVLQRVTQALTVDYSEPSTATAMLTINQPFQAIPDNIYDRMNRIKPAGVALEIRVTDSPTPFTFSTTGLFPPYFPEGRGFGTTAAGYESVGGDFTSTIT